jgi:hypothetical protein
MAQAEPIKVQKFLAGVDYPASKQDLIEHARQHNADPDVIEALEQLPDREYNGPNAVSSAVAKVTAH